MNSLRRRSIKAKFPNVALEVHPEAGPNDGFIVARVHTHNGCGISAKSDLVLKFGREGWCAAPSLTTPSKRFRGSLDLMFSRAAATQVAATMEEDKEDAQVVPKAKSPAVPLASLPDVPAVPAPKGPALAPEQAAAAGATEVLRSARPPIKLIFLISWEVSRV